MEKHIYHFEGVWFASLDGMLRRGEQGTIEEAKAILIEHQAPLEKEPSHENSSS